MTRILRPACKHCRFRRKFQFSVKEIEKTQVAYIFEESYWFDRLLLQFCCFGHKTFSGTKLVKIFIQFRIANTRSESTCIKWMIFHPFCKCDWRTMILKIGSAELHAVFNDGIKTFAGRLSFDRKDEIGTKQTAPKSNSNANFEGCLHAPTKYRTKNAVG